MLASPRRVELTLRVLVFTEHQTVSRVNRFHANHQTSVLTLITATLSSFRPGLVSPLIHSSSLLRSDCLLFEWTGGQARISECGFA
jgi:hypothetical protein